MIIYDKQGWLIRIINENPVIFHLCRWPEKGSQEAWALAWCTRCTLVTPEEVLITYKLLEQ